MNCNGRGSTNLRQGPILIKMPCRPCNGQGKLIKNPCYTCEATGLANSTFKEFVSIPNGIENNQIIRLEGLVYFLLN